MTIPKNNQISETSKLVQAALHEAEKPLLVAHQRPDGDAVGSLIGFGLALENAGKEPQMVIATGLPHRYNFLFGASKVTRKPEADFDLVISLDCANYERLSSPDPLEKVHINIDHHITNEEYADINFVLPNFAATTAVLAKYLPEWGFEITKDIANALLMGIVTDTIGFRTDNVNPEYLRITADLLKKGGDLVNMYHKALTIHSAAASKVWGFALSRLVIEGNLAWTSILIEDRKNAGYDGMDDADLTNHLSSLENCDLSILFNEQKNDKVKVSWRSNDKFNVTKIATMFSGGGHERAAGAEVDGKLQDVISTVLRETKNMMKGKILIGEI